MLSCNDCRRRKLKCDRELPCNRCINGNIADECAYETRALGESRERSVKRQRQNSVPIVDTIENPLASAHVRESLYCSDNTQSDISAKVRIEQLEREVLLLQTKQSFVHRHRLDEEAFGFYPSSSENAVDRRVGQTGMLKGHDSATFFYGPSSIMSIIAHVSTLLSFEAGPPNRAQSFESSWEAVCLKLYAQAFTFSLSPHEL